MGLGTSTSSSGTTPVFSSLDPDDSNLTDSSSPDVSDVTDAYAAGQQGGGSFTPTIDLNTGGLTGVVNDTSAGIGELVSHPVKFLEDLFGYNSNSTAILPPALTGGSPTTTPTGSPGQGPQGNWLTIVVIGAIILFGVIQLDHYMNN